MGAPCWAEPVLFESRGTSEKAWWTRRKRQHYTTACEMNLRWPEPIYMRVGYVFDLCFSE